MYLVREVILPKGNEKDVRDVPQEVREKMAFTFAAMMDEVFHLALLPKASATPADRVADEHEGNGLAPATRGDAPVSDGEVALDTPVRRSRKR